MKVIKTSTYKGTRILVGNNKRKLINKMINLILDYYPEVNEIHLPIINFEKTFKDKIGEENNNMMYKLTDRGGRKLCLAPEYTSLVQQLAFNDYKHEKDVILFYVSECFRGEKPQKGRYRQFTQLGVEILNPSNEKDSYVKIKDLAARLCNLSGLKLNSDEDVTRGLSFYKEDKGFEIIAPDLGSSKQICGGGIYEGGVGFAIGVDRILSV